MVSEIRDVHGLTCLGRTDKKIRDEYLYVLVCPYCGEIFEATHTQVKAKTGRKLGKNHCGCQTLIRQQHRAGISPTNKMDDKTRTVTAIFQNYRSSAEAKGLEFELRLEDFSKIVFENCYYCGGLPAKIRALGQGKWKRMSVPSNGIDRIDSSLGYTINNVLPCCAECNYFKVDRNNEEFLNLIKRIYENLKLGSLSQSKSSI